MVCDVDAVVDPVADVEVDEDEAVVDLDELLLAAAPLDRVSADTDVAEVLVADMKEANDGTAAGAVDLDLLLAVDDLLIGVAAA